ncbi:MAG: YraN family protein [Candidatus Omnitrophota bacterium]
MSKPGSREEKAAAEFLRRRGYRILGMNYRCPAGEIDIIAGEKGVICFVEVKSRNSDACGSPAEAVTPAKKRRLCRAAACYLASAGWSEKAARFDVVTVLDPGGDPEWELFRDAFECEE